MEITQHYWTQEEDKRLMELYSQHLAWSSIAQEMQKQFNSEYFSSDNCYERWVQVLQLMTFTTNSNNDVQTNQTVIVNYYTPNLPRLKKPTSSPTKRTNPNQNSNFFYSAHNTQTCNVEKTPLPPITELLNMLDEPNL